MAKSSSSTERENLDPLCQEILGLCKEDFIGLWLVAAVVEDSRPQGNVLLATISALRKLLDPGLIRAGFPTQDGQGFQAWECGPKEAISRIEFEWRRLGRMPIIGEVAWFVATEVKN